jgi:hypothetical protein
LAPRGQRFFDGDNDTAGLWAQGLEGTEHLEPGRGRIDLSLQLCGHPDHGVLLWYRKWGRAPTLTCGSKGDVRRLREWVETRHEDLRPIGLFISCESALMAVTEFVQRDGELPKCIEWISESDLPPEAFPDPAKIRN